MSQFVTGLLIGWAFLRGTWFAVTGGRIALRLVSDGRILSFAYGDGCRDDTRNFQRAIDRAAQVGIPAGEYRLDSAVHLGGPVRRVTLTRRKRITSSVLAAWKVLMERRQW